MVSRSDTDTVCACACVGVADGLSFFKSTHIVCGRTNEYFAFATSPRHGFQITKSVDNKSLSVFGVCESTTAPDSIAVCEWLNHRIVEYRNIKELALKYSLNINGSTTPSPDARVVVKFTDGSCPVKIVPCGDGTPDYIVVFSTENPNRNRIARISGVDGQERWTTGADWDKPCSDTSSSEGSKRSDYEACFWGVAVLPGAGGSPSNMVIADCKKNRLQVLDIATGAAIKQLG